MLYPRVISYIDGFNLYYGLRESNLRWAYWLNLQTLSEKYLKPGQTLVHTKYFTSRVSFPPEKRQRQTTFLEALQTLSDLTIFYGQFLSETMVCSACGHSYTTYHEKMTDVNIALQMVTDAIHDRFDVALLFSADSDLVSAIKTISELTPMKKVIVIFPPGRNSKMLIQNAHGFLRIDDKTLSKCLFPDPVKKPGGYLLHRPPAWR